MQRPQPALIHWIGLLLAWPLAARPFITLGPSDGLALDQPRVTVEFIDGGGASLGPDLFASFLLDTGAERMLVAGSALSELSDGGYQTNDQILEQGVSGFTLFDVSVPYRMDVTGTAGDIVSLTGVRALSNPSADFGSFGGIVGMPGMVGRVTCLDFTGFGTGDFFDAFVGVELRGDLPAGSGHRYSVPLKLIEFPIDEPTPPTTASGIPFMTAIIDSPVRQRRGRFLLDTGAQISILSERLAFALGLDADDDGNFVNEQTTSTTINGVGGPIEVPILTIGNLRLPTSQGTDMVWTDVSAVILEIHPLIDGVFGSDLLTSGWLEAFLSGGGDGLIQQCVLDFREADQHRGDLMLDITAGIDMPAPGLPPVDLDNDHIDDAWELLFFDDLDGTLADTDGDRLPLVLENALNTDPARHDSNPLRISRHPDGTISLSHPRNVELPFINLVVEHSTTPANPASWSSLTPASSSVTFDDALTERVTMTLPVPLEGDNGYYRLRVFPAPVE